MHLNQQVFHALHFSLFYIESDLQRLASLINSFFLCLLESIKLPQLGLFSINLLLPKAVDLLSQLVDALLLLFDLPLSRLSLLLVHVDLRAALLSLTDSSHSPGLLLIKHSSQFSGLGLSALFFLFVELLKLLILAVLVDHSVLKAVIGVLQCGNLVR